MDLSTWHGMRTRDPRRLALASEQWNTPRSRTLPEGGESEAREIASILVRARDVGLRTIDTARAYSNSENCVGRATANQEGWRIVTKLSPDVHSDGVDISEALERVDRSLEESRLALRLDALPVLLLNRFGHRHACGGRLWRKLLAEREAGRIVSLGAVAATPEEAWAALEDPDLEVLQVASSLLDLRLHRQGFFPRARELGRTIYVLNRFREGVADLDPERLPRFLADLIAPMRTIRACAKRLGVTPRALHLAFVRDLPGAYPIVGCETDLQLRELLEDWADEKIDAASIAFLVDALPTLDSDALDPACWPTTEPATSPQPTRTRATSIATMRA